MAQPSRYSIAATAATPVYVPNWHITPFNIDVTVNPGTGCTYSVQYTLDDVFASNFSATSATWFNHPDATNATTTATIQFVSPVTGIQVNQSTYGSGATTVVILQAGISQGS